MALSQLNNEDLFGQLLRTMPLAFDRAGSTTTDGTRWIRPIALDVKEKDKNYEVLADIPGVDKKDIKLQVEGDVLSIAVEKESGDEETQEQEDVKWHRIERAHTYYRRSLRMPEAADLTSIKAKYDNGVLRLDVPKVEKARSHTVEIM